MHSSRFALPSLFAHTLAERFEDLLRRRRARAHYPKGANAPLLERAQARLAAGDPWDEATAGLLPSEKAFLRAPEPKPAPLALSPELDALASRIPGARRVNVDGEPLVIVSREAI